MNNHPWLYPIAPCYYSCLPITPWNFYEQANQTLFSDNLNNPYQPSQMNDHGGKPYVININQATKQNNTFRTAIWTGEYLQVTLMCINVGDDIGLEVHQKHDQFLRVEAGEGLVQMGNHKNQLLFQRRVGPGSAIMVPAGTWHNIINTGNQPLELYSIYAPPEHKFGTIHRTKQEALHSH